MPRKRKIDETDYLAYGSNKVQRIRTRSNGTPLATGKYQFSDHRNKFTPLCDAKLLVGVSKYGQSSWKKILANFDFPHHRTAMHLKDRWRTLQSSGTVNLSVEGTSFKCTSELRGLYNQILHAKEVAEDKTQSKEKEKKEYFISLLLHANSNCTEEGKSSTSQNLENVKNLLPSDDDSDRKSFELYGNTKIKTIDFETEIKIYSPVKTGKTHVKHKQKFTSSCDAKILAGVSRFGIGSWTKILDNYDFPSYRTPTHLKDRWRTLVRNRSVRPSSDGTYAHCTKQLLKTEFEKLLENHQQNEESRRGGEGKQPSPSLNHLTGSPPARPLPLVIRCRPRKNFVRHDETKSGGDFNVQPLTKRQSPAEIVGMKLDAIYDVAPSTEQTYDVSQAAQNSGVDAGGSSAASANAVIANDDVEDRHVDSQPVGGSSITSDVIDTTATTNECESKSLNDGNELKPESLSNYDDSVEFLNGSTSNHVELSSEKSAEAKDYDKNALTLAHSAGYDDNLYSAETQISEAPIVNEESGNRNSNNNTKGECPASGHNRKRLKKRMDDFLTDGGKSANKRKYWTNREMENLMKGVDEYGKGNWKLILEKFDFDDRSAVMLKDKYRQLEQGGNMDERRKSCHIQ